ncbi:MAG: tetratricopeptide repeat protein [Saprospiraceae bacterium]|nr:tetratricopeptide repeat protein [Lewinella sp.]
MSFFQRIFVIFQKGSPFRQQLASGTKRIRRLLDLKAPEAWLQTFSSLLLRSGAILLFLGLLLFLWRSLVYEGYTIQSFNVPKVLQDSGFDGTVIARRLEDHYLLLKKDAATIKEDSVQAIGDEQQPELNVDVLGVGLSLKSIGFYLRDLIGRKNNLIRGEITQTDQTLALTLRMTGAQPETVTQSLDQGYQMAIDGILNDAAKLILKNTDPYRLAIYYTHMGEHDQAIATARQMLLDRSNEQHWAYLAWGVALEKKDAPEEAMEKFEWAIQSQPDFALGWLRKAYLLRDQGHLEEALPALEKVIELDPDKASFWNSYAYLLDALGKQEASDEAFRQATEHSDDAYLLFNWADKKAGRGQLAEANEILDDAIKKAQKKGDIIGETDAQLFKAMLEQDSSKIRKYAHLKIALQPDNPFTIQLTTTALYRTGLYNDAIAIGKKVQDIYRSVEEKQRTLNMVAMAFNFSGQPDSGLVYAREAIAVDSTVGYPYSTLAEAYHFTGHRDRFLQYLSVAFEKGLSPAALKRGDPPYDQYWEDPEFQQLKSQYEK